MASDAHYELVSILCSVGVRYAAAREVERCLDRCCPGGFTSAHLADKIIEYHRIGVQFAVAQHARKFAGPGVDGGDQLMLFGATPIRR